MIQQEKQNIRARCLARRDALPQSMRAAHSKILGERDPPFLHDIGAGAVVSGFLPIRSEIDPRPMMRRLAAKGYRLTLPRIIGGKLEFAGYAFGDPLAIGDFGTSVPTAEALALDPDLMLVPLAAFDRRGGRIGYGKGFYDNAIARIERRKRVVTVGLAFSVQETDEVPMEAHDRRLDWILTETGILRTA